LPRREPLRLTQPAGIGRHEPITPRVALLLELAKEPHRDIAARIPALQERRCIGVEQTVAMVAAAFAPRKRGAPEIALDGAQTQPDLLRNRRGGPALAVQGPDLRMQRLPAGLALRRPLLRRQGNIVGGHGHGQRPRRQRHGLLAHRRIDRVERLAVRAEHLVQGFPEILQHMKPVCDCVAVGAP
jgi:hypothetical protein